VLDRGGCNLGLAAGIEVSHVCAIREAGRESPSSISELQPRLRTLVEHVRAIDLRAYEVAAAEEIATGLCPATRTLLGEACVLLDELLVHDRERDREPVPSQLPFERDLDLRMESIGSTPSRTAFETVADIAFVARLELRQHGMRLAELARSRDAATLLAECDSALRHLHKAMTALDAAIANAIGAPPSVDFTSTLQVSLAVRRAYAKFRALVSERTEPEPDELHARLRRSGIQIAMLIGWAAYPDLRIRDRLLLRGLQRRILAWLPDGDTAVGFEIWYDFITCVDMLALVNYRQELLEHDAMHLAHAAAVLEGAAPIDTLHSALLPLRGLDPELDAALEAPLDPYSLGPILDRLTTRGAPAW